MQSSNAGVGQQANQKSLFESYVSMAKRMGKDEIAQKINMTSEKANEYSYEDLAEMLSGIKQQDLS